MTNRLEAFNPTEAAQLSENSLKPQWSAQDSGLARQLVNQSKSADVESLGFKGFHDFSIVDDKAPGGNEKNAKDDQLGVRPGGDTPPQPSTDIGSTSSAAQHTDDSSTPKDVHADQALHRWNRDQPQYPEARAGGRQVSSYDGTTTSYHGEDSETKGPYMDVNWTRNTDGSLSKVGWEVSVDKDGVKRKDIYNQDGSHVEELEKPDGQKLKAVYDTDGTSSLEIFNTDGTGQKVKYDKNAHAVSRDVVGKDGKITHTILD